MLQKSFPLCTALSMALLLSSCGKQEAVDDVPSSEELAKKADEASKAIRDQEDADAAAIDTSSMTSYANRMRGFTILVPKDWTVDEDASDNDGQTFSDAQNQVTLKAGWVENLEDADLTDAVKELENAGSGVTGGFVTENEYRASGTLEDGQKTARRFLRKPDGTLIKAVVHYPAEKAETLDPLVKQILDSLTLR